MPVARPTPINWMYLKSSELLHQPAYCLEIFEPQVTGILIKKLATATSKELELSC